ncbi:ABC transporter ATP-binding protein, partial [Gemmiger formicilis]
MKVELKNVSKRLNDVTVLEDISLTLESGTIYGLKGKNGCGKTMLMRMMAGLIYPTSGTVSIDGEILHKDIATPRSIGVLIENPAFLPGYTGQQNLELLAGLTGKADRTQIAKTMSRVGLAPNDKRTYRKYSLGMKQRLGIACALMECPDLILLDEPINAIDEKGVPKIWETSVYKGYKQDKIEMRGDRAEMSDFPLYLNTVAGGLDRRDQTIGGFS